MESHPEIEVLWDGGSMIVVDKPAGIATQAPPGCDSLESRLRAQFAQRSDYVAMPHRLDRLVGGVTLVAFQKKTARLLSEQFAARRIEKEYLAWVEGALTVVDTPWIDWLRKVPDQARVVAASPDEPGAKEARPRVSLVGVTEDGQQTLLKLFPETGRMHQLRFQTSRRGHPIVGDTLYNAQALQLPGQTGSHSQTGSSSQADSHSPTESTPKETPIRLQAAAIRFRDPRTARIVEVSVKRPISAESAFR